MLDKVKPAAIGARPASVSVNFWQLGGAEDNSSQFSRQVTRAELLGDDILMPAALPSGRARRSGPLGIAIDLLAVRP